MISDLPTPIFSRYETGTTGFFLRLKITFLMPIVDIFTNSCINMLPEKLSGKKTVVADNYLFAPDNVRDRPLISGLICVYNLSI